MPLRAHGCFRPARIISAAFGLLALPVSTLYAGSSLSLNGSSQYVTVPATAGLTPTPLTFEAWVNPSAATCNTIISRGHGGTADTDYIFQVGYDGTNCGVMKVAFFGAGAWDCSVSTVPTNTWTHVAVTYDGTNKQFFINGVWDATANRPGPLFLTSSSPLYIGRQGVSCDCNFFHGQLSEVRIWNTVRTASEVTGDMNPTPGGQSGQVVYYHLNEGAGTTANDVSGNGLAGTLAGGASWAGSAPPALGAISFLEGRGAGTGSVVLQSLNMAWTASANASWLHLSPAYQSGTGSTNVIFSFDANPGPTRTGTLSIASFPLTIIQAGSTYIAAPVPLTTLAQGNNLTDLAVDPSGNVYLLDSGSSAIYQWSPANNTATPVITGTLFGVATDASGNVYFSDAGPYEIEKWSAASHTVTPLISNITTALAVDAVGNVYFSDTVTTGSQSSSAVQEWSALDGSVTSPAFLGPGDNTQGVAVDCAGNIYYSDFNQGVVRERLALNGDETLPAAGLGNPGSVAVDGAGNIFVANFYSAWEWSAASNTLTYVGLSLGLHTPYAIASDVAGNLYIIEHDSQRLVELLRAFIDPTARTESAAAGTDTLPPVLPASENLRAPFAPASDQSWLTITGATNGVVSFSFAQNTGAARTAHISLLGASISVTQSAGIGIPALLTDAHFLPNGSLQFRFTNQPGAFFTILASTNLSLPLSNWTSLGAPTEGPSGQYQFTDAAPTNSARFYIFVSP